MVSEDGKLNKHFNTLEINLVAEIKREAKF